MPEYRRMLRPGGTFFLTLVTHGRRPRFAGEDGVIRLRSAIAAVRAEAPFEVVAGVVLPDHGHFLWTLPPGDSAYSTRIAKIKIAFTKSLPPEERVDPFRAESRVKHRESDVWQRRFWEHTIRDDDDLRRHLDYIHYNPVKHGLAACPHAWSASSFHRWVLRRGYDPTWCCCCDGRTVVTPEFDDIALACGE